MYQEKPVFGFPTAILSSPLLDQMDIAQYLCNGAEQSACYVMTDLQPAARFANRPIYPDLYCSLQSIIVGPYLLYSLYLELKVEISQLPSAAGAAICTRYIARAKRIDPLNHPAMELLIL